MSQRPGGQGPVRGGARPAGRGAARRGPERGDTAPGRFGRYAMGEPHTDARSAGPRGESRTGADDVAGGDRQRGPGGPREPSRISGRAAALGLVLVALVLAYAYPLRLYLAQQAEIARLEEDTRAQREHIQELADEVARWNDDEYVKAQARQRFMLVEVGEQIYVLGYDPTTAQEEGDPTPPTWYEQLWTGVQTADDPPAPPDDAAQDPAP